VAICQFFMQFSLANCGAAKDVHSNFFHSGLFKQFIYTDIRCSKTDVSELCESKFYVYHVYF